VQPQSRAWLQHLAKTQGGYFYPWSQTLEASGGEQHFDALLESLLAPQTHVLEAGCAEGKDAARFGSKVASWTGYDFVPEFLELARQNVPSTEFVYWHSSKQPTPKSLQNHFDLVVSRRGPTSVIDHLP
jgi:SAM-dependent methyltransferase